jgi:hypothetical protein
VTAVHCAGCAWGLECPRASSCVNHVDRATWEAQRFPYGQPGIERAREGWMSMACSIHRGEFDNYQPIDTKTAELF